MTGISITTRDRPDVLEYTLGKMDETLTDERVIVIDDHSWFWQENRSITRRYGLEYIRNKEWLGIPHSKNVGLETLIDCDRQFWFDDDCFPLEGWQDRFIGAMEFRGHLLYLKQWAHIKPKGRADKQGIVEFTNATACFMSFRKDQYDKVRGFTRDFMKYGHWHGYLSKLMGGYYSLADVEDYLYSFDLDGKPADFDGSFDSVLDKDTRKGMLKEYYRRTKKKYTKI